MIKNMIKLKNVNIAISKYQKTISKDTKTQKNIKKMKKYFTKLGEKLDAADELETPDIDYDRK